MNDKPSISFGDNANVDTFQTGEHAKVVHGDEVAGDKVGQQVQGDNHGTMDQVNVSHGDYVAKAKEAVGQLLGDLAKDFAPLDATDSLPMDDSTPGTPIEPEFHPLGIMADINAMADQDEPPSEPEEATLRDRFGAMLERLGDVGKRAIVKGGPIAVAGMKATASMSPPFSIICPMIEAAHKVFSKKPEATFQYDSADNAGW